MVPFLSLGETEHASSPPRGWNSYDSFCWTISEEEFLNNAELVAKRLLHHGYEVPDSILLCSSCKIIYNLGAFGSQFFNNEW